MIMIIPYDSPLQHHVVMACCGAEQPQMVGVIKERGLLALHSFFLQKSTTCCEVRRTCNYGVSCPLPYSTVPTGTAGCTGHAITADVAVIQASTAVTCICAASG